MGKGASLQPGAGKTGRARAKQATRTLTHTAYRSQREGDRGPPPTSYDYKTSEENMATHLCDTVMATTPEAQAANGNTGGLGFLKTKNFGASAGRTRRGAHTLRNGGYRKGVHTRRANAHDLTAQIRCQGLESTFISLRKTHEWPTSM